MKASEMPAEMTAVVLDGYDGPQSLRSTRRPVPKAGKNQVLVRVAAAAINPSDLSFINGRYRFRKPLPAVPGFEGSGTVVAAGGGWMSRYLLGKRVAVAVQQGGDGMWAEYVAARVSGVFPLAKAVSLEQGAMAIVNPLTAIALLSSARAGGHRAIINTAAGSNLGRMMERLAVREGVQVINVVRREEEAQRLREAGSGLVLNSAAPEFEEELRRLCQEHEVRRAFDAVGGDLTGRLLAAMLPGAVATVYGNLAQRPVQMLAGDLIQQGKLVDGFLLPIWTAKLSLPGRLRLWRRGQGLMSDTLYSEVRARYPLEQAREAVTEYQSRMSGGKVLLVP